MRRDERGYAMVNVRNETRPRHFDASCGRKEASPEPLHGKLFFHRHLAGFDWLSAPCFEKRFQEIQKLGSSVSYFSTVSPGKLSSRNARLRK
jgi:hypothetical protein